MTLRAAALAVALTAGTWFLARDAEAYSLTLSPVIVDLVVPAGETSTFRFTVVNNEEAPVPLRVYTWDYWYGTEGRYFTPPGTTPKSAAGWIEVVPQTTTVGGSEAVEFLGSLTVPPEASGGYYAIVFAQTDFGEGSGMGTRATAEGRLGTIVLVRIADTGTESIEVAEAKFSPPTVTTAAEVGLAVRNTGTVHVDTSFRGVIRTTDGEVLGSLASEGHAWVLPGETRTLAMRWSSTMEPGAYELVGSVLFGADRAVPIVLPLIVGDKADRVPSRGP